MSEASIQRIKEILVHPNAEKLEIAKILGWNVVVQKDQFKKDDLVVYCQIDSFLPIKPEFEFLRKSCYRKLVNGDEGFRIKTMQLRKELSQGICFPMSILDNKNVADMNEGTDVSDILGVRHYMKDIPICLSGNMKGDFPGFMYKTDETMVQSIPYKINELKGKPYYITTKMDGTSTSFYYRNDEFGVCSRNAEWLETEENTAWNYAKKNNIKEKLKRYGKNIAIQGELCGPSIQSNKIGLKELQFYIFNLFDIDTMTYLGYEEINNFCREYDMLMVPLEEVGEKFNYNMNELLEKAKGKYFGTQNEKEGIVVRSLSGRDVSFKVLNNLYLLGEE